MIYENLVEVDEANTLAKGVGVELNGVDGLTDGKLALIKKVKITIQLQDYSVRSAYEELGIERMGIRPSKGYFNLLS